MTTTARNTPVTIAFGDGIGPEIMKATLAILEAAKAPLSYETIEIGQKIYERGILSGIEPSAWESIRRTQLLLKAPITTPQGGGYKSLNVTIRKALGLYANVRPCRSYPPFVPTKHPVMDVVIIRENEEDTYAGIEYQQTDEVTQCLKLISKPGSEAIARYAFEYAHKNGRKKITCMVKDNIMKLTDGLFYEAFQKISQEYPDIITERQIIDIGSAHLADTPERFDVILTENLYGDIISDIAAQIAGSVGLAGSANIGRHFAMFEAIHGSAPTIAGKNIANPSALLQATVMLLTHIGATDIANHIQNAWLYTLENGLHTADIYQAGSSRERLSTEDFANAIINHLGKMPQTLTPANFKTYSTPLPKTSYTQRQKKELVGIDVYLHWDEADRQPHALGKLVDELNSRTLKLEAISNRGIDVYPEGLPDAFCTDHWRLRFLAKPRNGQSTGIGFATHADIIDLLNHLQRLGLDFIKTEHLYRFNGKLGFSTTTGE